MNFTELTKSLEAEIERGIEVLRSLDDHVYSTKHGEAGSIGAHFRHNLEFIESFVGGVESGEIDFCSRERDVRAETDRKYVIERFEAAVTKIDSFSEDRLERTLLVRSEISPDTWLESTVGRECEFVHSHTVHHYALVAAKLASLSIKSPREFGVAPSTLRYWDSLEVTTKGV